MGGLLAEMSLVREVQRNTWPLQRMTSIQPWTMTWGKLIGGTLWAWFVGFWVFLFMIMVYVFSPDSFFQSDNWILFQGGLFPAITFLIGLAILNHALCLLIGFGPMQMKFFKSLKVWFGASLVISGIVITSKLGIFFKLYGRNITLNWYSWNFQSIYFYLAEIWFLAGWAIMGVYMQMRKEFQMQNSPWPWIVFLIFISIYVMGFYEGLIRISQGTQYIRSLMESSDLWINRLYRGWIVVVIATYAIIIWQPPNRPVFNKLTVYFQKKKLHQFFNEIPRWIFSLIIVLLYFVIIFAYHIKTGGNIYLMNQPANTLSIVGSMTGFLIRDLGIIVFFCLSKDHQRALTTAIVYLAILYFLFPLIVSILKIESLKPLFLPDNKSQIPYAVFAAWIEAILIWVFVRKRWIEG